MTVSFHTARLGVRMAQSRADLLACQALRHARFFGAPGLDADAFDPLCRHIMVGGAGGLAGTCRVMILPNGARLAASYAATAYDLTPLAGYAQPVMELGRFCVRPGVDAAIVLQLVWGALTRLIDAERIGMVIGCSSFAGADPARHGAALALLGACHRGPPGLLPLRRAAQTVPLNGPVADRRAALGGVPPLLRSYLRLGGWVGDHAVVDRALDTLHVFTALQICDVPPARARLLRALA